MLRNTIEWMDKKYPWLHLGLFSVVAALFWWLFFAPLPASAATLYDTAVGVATTNQCGSGGGTPCTGGNLQQRNINGGMSGVVNVAKVYMTCPAGTLANPGDGVLQFWNSGFGSLLEDANLYPLTQDVDTANVYGYYFLLNGDLDLSGVYNIKLNAAVSTSGGSCVMNRQGADVVPGNAYYGSVPTPTDDAATEMAFALCSGGSCDAYGTVFGSALIPFGGGGGGSWGSDGAGDGGDVDWSDFFADNPIPECDAGAFDIGGFFSCIGDILHWAIIPPAEGFVDIVQQPMKMVASRWPFVYLTNFYEKALDGVNNASSCPLPTVGGFDYAGGDDAPTTNLCTTADGVTAWFNANPTVQGYMVLMVWLGLVGFAISKTIRFFRS